MPQEARIEPTEQISPSGAPVQRVTIGSTTFRVAPDQFRRVTDDGAQRALFKQMVDWVIIETSKYCNRRCYFCPNKDGTRLEAQVLMDDAMFGRIVDNLAAVDFSGMVLLHLYNEPLEDPLLIQRIAQLRAAAPSVRIGLNSNGDLLNERILDDLTAAGLNDLTVSIYGPRHGEWVHAYIVRRVRLMAKICGLALTYIPKDQTAAVTTSGPRVSASGGTLNILIRAENFDVRGYDRGGLIKAGPEAKRTSPCGAPFRELLITYDGSIIPCCNIYLDSATHADARIGNLSDERPLWAHYADSDLVSWRQSLLRFADHGGVCGACSRMNYPALDTPENRAAFDALTDSLTASLALNKQEA